MPAKKPPTRKQLAARRKFVAMVRRRAKEARAAKRGTTKRRNVAMGYMAGGVFHPIRGSSDYSPLRAGEKPGGRTRLRKKPKSAGRPRGAALAAARVGAKRRASHKRGVRVAHNPVSVIKNGRKLYGAAAQAVLAKRNSGKARKAKAQRRYSGTYTRGTFGGARERSILKTVDERRYKKRDARVKRQRKKAKPYRDTLGGFFKNGKRQGVLLSGRKRNAGYKAGYKLSGGSTLWTGSGKTPSGAVRKARKSLKSPYHKTEKIYVKRNGIFRTAARAAISKRLLAPIRFGRRRNGEAPAGIEEMHEKFLGRETSHSFEITAPQGTPHDVAVLGELVALKTEDEEFVFDKGEAFMGADAKGNLYVLGDVQVESSTNFGEIEEIDYLARKDHLEANPFRWKRRRKARRNPGQLIEYYHEFGEEGGTLPKLKTDADGMMHITGGSYTIELEGITD